MKHSITKNLSVIALINLLLLSAAVRSEDIHFATGFAPEPYELASSVREANPLHMKHRGLPSSVDLSDSMPPVGYQGRQSSCVAWSTAYAAKSYQEYIERKKTGWKLATADGSPDFKTVFSPAFIYNQINGGRDNGSSIFDAMKLVVEKGAVPWADMPYNPDNYLGKPDSATLHKAAQYKARDFIRLRYNEPDEIKSQLALGRPVVAGLIVYENFHSLKGEQIYNNGAGKVVGGHAVTIVGYDDSKKAFKFINSWSARWGDNGYGYIDYQWFTRTCKSAYVMIDDTVAQDSSQPEKPEENKNKIRPPAEINATQGNYPDKIILTWESVEGAIGYEIYRKSPGGSFQKTGLSTRTSFEDTGIQPGIAYSYKIASVFEDGVSDQNEGETTGYASAEGKARPGKVSGLRASAGIFSGKIQLEWEPLENAQGYNVFKYRNGSYTKIGMTAATGFTDTGPAGNGVIEYYKITAFNRDTAGDESDAVAGFTMKNRRPSPPAGIMASRGEFKDKVTVKWSPAENSDSYMIYKYPVAEKQWKVAGVSRVPAFEDKQPEKGMIYYAVAARSGKTISRFSSYASGYTDPNVRRAGKRLPAPDSLTVALNDSTASLKWSKVSGADEYNIWRRETGGKKWDFIGRADGAASSYAAAVTEKDKFFLYSVTAKSLLGGDSEHSRPVSVVISEPKAAVASRTFGGESRLEKFKGTWNAMQWDGAGVKNVVLEISADETNSEYKVTFNKKVIFQGEYIQDSTIIRKDGFSIQLSSDEDSLLVNLKDEKILSKKDELAFLKE